MNEKRRATTLLDSGIRVHTFPISPWTFPYAEAGSMRSGTPP